MKKTNEEILSTITPEQWKAIEAYYAEKAEISTLENRVTNLLNKIGCPAHLKGYRYIRYAVILVYNEPKYIESVTKALYPKVADEFKTTWSRVERAIRHAIEVIVSRGDIKILQEIFCWSSQKDKPTNSEAIASVVEYLKKSM